MSQTTALIPKFTAGDRFRKAREITGLDRKQFAELIGLHRETVARCEADGTKKALVLRAWAQATGVDEMWLRDGESNPSDYKATVSRVRAHASRPTNRKGNTGPKGRA